MKKKTTRVKAERPHCYLITLTPVGSLNFSLQDIKKTLAREPHVLRITDHGEHLKVLTRGDAAPLDNPNVKVRRVVDKTTHWDEKYWDFAMAAYRHAVMSGQSDDKPLRVMIHYLCNLFGTPDEAEFLASLAVRRARLDAEVSAEQAHGWELRHTKKMRRGAK